MATSNLLLAVLCRAALAALCRFAGERAAAAASFASAFAVAVPSLGPLAWIAVRSGGRSETYAARRHFAVVVGAWGDWY